MVQLHPEVARENIQHSTFNAQPRTNRRRAPHENLGVGCWTLNVECLKFFLLVAFVAFSFNVSASGVRVRDLVMISGARDNQLVGYGLVAGLAGDGDKDQVYTKQTVANLLMRYGINIPASTLSAKNVAVVMVTADIPPFLKNGARIDVTVASMGDAKSLSGGVLLQTPLLGADGKVYAVAQGPLVLGGFAAGEGGAGGATVTKNHPTTAQIINGALVERKFPRSSSATIRLNCCCAIRVSIPPPQWRRRSTKCSPTPRTPLILRPCRCGCRKARKLRRWISFHV